VTIRRPPQHLAAEGRHSDCSGSPLDHLPRTGARETQGTFFALLPDNHALSQSHRSEPNAELERIGISVAGSRTVLLAEDEEIVRKLLRTVLEREGYRVLEACSGQEAVEIAERHNGPIDVLVVDLVMPVMDGPKVSERVTRRRPGTEVIFMTGYGNAEAARLPAFHVLLQKPFPPKTLVERIRQALDHSEARQPTR
jgi:two-component system cell cycle sensor histidine kinase/response regulator CckA